MVRAALVGLGIIVVALAGCGDDSTAGQADAGSGGTSASGGTSGSGGTSASGGTSGSGGASGAGGSTGFGGSSGAGGTSGAGGASGLDFPGSAAVSTTMRFQFLDPQTHGLPIWGPAGQGATYVWRAYPRQQPGYYTTFFWGTTGNFTWGGYTYYGFHPYPQKDGTVHRWEIAGDNGGDFLGDDVIYDRWFTQVARVWADGSGKHMEFYWDWPDQSKLLAHTAGTSYGNGDPPAPALTWGDAPWPSSTGIYGPSGEGNEVYDGILRGIQIYSDKLSLADVQSEIDSPVSTAAGKASIWYLNIDPTPTDISDKSGQGHDPEWVGAERPSLYQE
ncbi:MAG: hypothetical protein KC776_25370 [Myxococcales bacterium]|nr:hypothetical protein [Myxococcales bacterium]MCB9581789.1 hypothetical protein [Polyangiaceae bacterium]